MIYDPAEAIARALARPGGKIADGTAEMSYADVAVAMEQVNATLAGAGITATDCLALVCGNDLPSAIVLLALLAGGRNFLLLPPAPPAGQAGHMVMAETFCRYRLQPRAPQGTPHDWVVITKSGSWQADPPAGPPCFFVPTSGSSARAKIVRHFHGRLLQAATFCAERLGLTAADRIALPVPIAHMFGLGAAFIPAILAGACIDIQAQGNVLRFLARERLFCPNVAFLIPGFADSIERLRKVPRRYRITVMAGDRLTADLFDRYETLHGCVVNLYGSSELGVIAAGDPADPAHLRRATIGRLMAGAEIRHEAGRAADKTHTVPLYVAHRFGFECYVGMDGRAVREPDSSQASGDGFRTGDIGRLVDGYLVVYGRGDDLVNRDGILTGCGDVAAAIATLPGIAEAVVLGGVMSRRGSTLIAFCVLAKDCHWQGADLRKACLTVLPTRAVPDAFLFLPALPRLANGKVDRLALRHAHVSDDSDTDADIA